MGNHRDLLSRSDIIALIIGGITIAINLIAINHLCRCYHRRKLHEQAVSNNTVSNNINLNGTTTYTTTAPPLPNSPINDHRDANRPRPHRVDLESGLCSSRQNINPIPTAPNLQAILAGAPNIQFVIPPLPQRPPPVQRKLEDEGIGRHGLSLDNYLDRVPSVGRERRLVYVEK